LFGLEDTVIKEQRIVSPTKAHLYRIVRMLYCLGRVLIRDIALEPFVFCHLPLLSMVLKV